jgi:serine/threonine protein kinase
MQSWLRLVSLNSENSDVDVSEGSIAIGTGDNCFIRAVSPIISGLHCIVEEDQEEREDRLKNGEKEQRKQQKLTTVAYVTDKSRHGTYLNGKKLTKDVRHVLSPGDQLSLVFPSASAAMKSKADTGRFYAYVVKYLDLNKDFDTAAPVSLDEEKESNSESSSSSSSASSKYDNLARGGPEIDYLVKRDLGSGNFAVVRLAVHKRTGARVAIKVIDRHKFGATNLKKDAIQGEIDILKRLNHDGIIRVIDIYETPDEISIVMELVEGGDLFDRIVEKKRYAEEEARALFYRLAECIKYLHDEGVAHRDLKPESMFFFCSSSLAMPSQTTNNALRKDILLVSHDNDTDIKLTDFGIAKVMDENQLMQTLCGTPQYVAPEVISKATGIVDGYSKAVDLWSMGVILFVLIAGYPPFGDQDFDKILKARYTFRRDRWAHVSPHAKDLIAKLLVVDPSKRLTIEQTMQHDWLNPDRQREEEEEEEEEKEKEEEEAKKMIVEEEVAPTRASRKRAQPPTSTPDKESEQPKRQRRSPRLNKQ